MRVAGYFWKLLCVFSLTFGFCEGFEGVPDTLRVWSALNYVLNGQDFVISSLYGLCTGVVENESGLPLVDAVAEKLKDDFSRPDEASLLKMYYDLYPMGISTWVDETLTLDNSVYFILNGRKFEKADDVFYIKSGDLKAQSARSDAELVLPGETIIGKDPESPVILFYGCPLTDSDFDVVNQNMYAEAFKSGKFRFVLRSTCAMGDFTDTPAFSVGLTPKNTIKNEPWNLKAPPQLSEEFNSKILTWYEPSKDELKDLDIYVTSKISRNYENSKSFSSMLNYAKNIANYFPLISSQLVGGSRDENIIKSNEEMKEKGVDFNLLGLYVNGQQILYSRLDEYSLLDTITSEYSKMKDLVSILQKGLKRNVVPTAKKLLFKYSQLSFSNLREMQPVKIDLHRHPAFASSVIYFNDIEKDTRYRGFSSDIEAFFAKSKYGELPEYRKNWNEVIFVINFSKLQDPLTVEALSGLLRALTIIQQGYPQRIGLLPLFNKNDDSVVKRLYQEKHKSLSKTQTFLQELLDDEIVRTAHQQPILDEVDEIATVSDLLEELEIEDTSIIINGEIYPFKSNAWHYLVTKVVKKDITNLKAILEKQNLKTDVDVRGLLHLKSSNGRSKKFTPDYFADSIYTTLNNTVLKELKDNIIEYTSDSKLSVLHTITIGDDFDRPDALNNLVNLLHIKYSGIRIRLINVGLKNSRNWAQLRNIFEKDEIASNVEKLANKTKSYKKKLIEYPSAVLSKWMKDISSKIHKKPFFITINGKFFLVSDTDKVSKNMFELILQREAKKTLDTMFAIEQVAPVYSNTNMEPDTIEEITALLSTLFYQNNGKSNNGIDYKTESTLPRLEIHSMMNSNNVTIFENSKDGNLVDVLLIIDPLEERSQKVLSLISKFERQKFINFKIVFLPTNELTIMPIRRLYIDNVDYAEDILDEAADKFEMEFDVNSPLVLNEFGDVENILIEAHVFGENDTISHGNVDGVGGVCLKLVNKIDETLDTAISMNTFGYTQFKLNKLETGLRVESCDSEWDVVSFSVDGRPDYVPDSSFAVTDYHPTKLHIKVRPSKPIKKKSIDSPDTIDIMTILKDRSQLELYKEMVLQITSQCPENQKIRFWTVKQPFFNEEFTKFCQDFNQNTNIPAEINIRSYQWPYWLRPQRFYDRRMDVFKILFADVLLPTTVSRVVYIDVTQKVPNPFAILESAKHGDEPFQMLPMKGTGYWDEGYWEKFLTEKNLKFHSLKPTFIINLDKLRITEGGDKLRIHYQRLSSDINSLVNIDQDLVNDAQLAVPIAALKRSTVSLLKPNGPVLKIYKNQLAASTNEAQMIHDEL